MPVTLSSLNTAFISASDDLHDIYKREHNCKEDHSRHYRGNDNKGGLHYCYRICNASFRLLRQTLRYTGNAFITRSRSHSQLKNAASRRGKQACFLKRLVK